MKAETAPFGAWRSPLRLEEVFARPSAPLYPFRYGRDLCWLEAVAADGGRIVLSRRDPEGVITTLTPKDFNIRSRVHEYGGKCFGVTGEWLLFSNYADGRLYRQRMDGSELPKPLTSARGIDGFPTSYADLQVTTDGHWLICVAEVTGKNEHRNLLTAVDLEQGSDEPCVLVSGCDFYASPLLSPDEGKIAWLEWDNPHMPWDECRLQQASLERPEEGGLVVGEAAVVAGGPGCSVCQPQYAADGSLLYAMDSDQVGHPASKFWNIYRWREGVSKALSREEKEYGEPFWVFGETRYTLVEDSIVVGVRTAPKGDELVKIDLRKGKIQTVKDGFARCSHFRSERGESGSEVLFVASYADREPALVCFDPCSGQLETLRGGEQLLSLADTSLPQAIRYPTRDGGIANAWYYPPMNSGFDPLPEGLPPLIVMVHGGPTTRADNAFAPLKQFFTGSGFALLDVNHRGSSGFGRRYRQALLGNWGEIDADDVADAIAYVVAAGLIDGESVFIRGSSAGGYAVLRALTRFPELFRGGACYYGIGNLITLAESTHKFEAKYIDRLIGEPFDPQRAKHAESRYHQRSPIFSMERIRSPLILFQGLDDKVVPPQVSREVVEVLRRNGIMYEYVEYMGEGHGFRSAATKVDSLRKEIAFYGKVLSVKKNATNPNTG